MRTLDEVIAELEDEGLFADALHYLLEYRMMMDDIAEKRETLEEKISHYCDLIKIETDHYALSKVRWAEEYKNIKDDYEALQDFWAESQANPPLTWDELKQMEEKPVWIEVCDPIDEKTGWHAASWKLIEFINDEYFVVRNSDGAQENFYKSENDSYCWQAYRKER